MSRLRTLPRSFCRRAPEEVAPDLLGRYLVHETGGERLVVALVEVEAYLGAGDRAAHTFGGRRTARVRSMYLGGGHAYVYFVYGMHHCVNVVVGEVDSGQAVLLRGAVPIEGEARMRALRGIDGSRSESSVAIGPARLCQALAIDRRLDGAPLWKGQLRLAEGDPAAIGAVLRTPRIGVDYAGEAASWPLRWVGRMPEALRPSRPSPSEIRAADAGDGRSRAPARAPARRGSRDGRRGGDRAAGAP